MKKIRHYQRYTVSGSGFVYHLSTQNAEFFINNISASGMNITAEAELAEYQVITMEIQVSGNILPYSKQLKGKVVRKSKYGTINHYGVQFMELNNKDIIEIDEYLHLNYSSAAPHRTSFYISDDNPMQLLRRKNDA